MATLNIEGRNVSVDDSFLKLSPADQQTTVDEIASHFAPPPDKYQQAAIDEQSDLKAKGIDEGAGLTRRLVHGATLGADSTLLAGALAPVEAIKRGVGLGEGYNFAKAREDQIMNDARANTGYAGTAAELLGGGVAGGGVASGGLTAGRFLSSSPGLLGRTAATAADAGALGGVAGFNEGNGLQGRIASAGQGALTGALIGGALPVAGAAARGVASPFISNIMARIDPEGYARRQVARGIIESGRPTGDIASDVSNAASEGQGVYNVADAMGNAGQRMLSSVARAPGEGRTAVVNALEARQGMQGRRVSNALAEGFDAPETAAQTEARLTAARGAEADAAYGAVRNDARPVDLTDAIAEDMEGADKEQADQTEAEAIRKEIDELRGVRPEAQAKVDEPELDVEKVLSNPKIKTAIEEQIGHAESARQQYVAGLDAATQIAQQTFISQFPEFANIPPEQHGQALLAMRQQDPDRYNRVSDAVTKSLNLFEQQKAAHEWQQQRNASEFAQYAKAEDARFAEMTKGEDMRRIEAEIPQMLSDLGVNPAEWLKAGSESKFLRSAVAQKILVDAAKYRQIMRAPKPTAARQPAPHVQRPGVSAPRQSSADTNIAALDRRLSATGSQKDAWALYEARLKTRR